MPAADTFDRPKPARDDNGIYINGMWAKVIASAIIPLIIGILGWGVGQWIIQTDRQSQFDKQQGVLIERINGLQSQISDIKGLILSDRRDTREELTRLRDRINDGDRRCK